MKMVYLAKGIIDETEFNVDLIVRELMQPLYYIWGTFDPEALVGSIPKFLEDWDLESFIAALMNPAYWEQVKYLVFITNRGSGCCCR